MRNEAHDVDNAAPASASAKEASPSHALQLFTHRFVPASDASKTPPTLLLLHGTGGDENDLLPLGKLLLPGAALLGLRGQALENGMPRFFRRFAEGVFDEDDLIARTHDLDAFINAASAAYKFDRTRLFAVGYSNGANIAASLLMLHADALAGAALFHPMVPFHKNKPATLPSLADVRVLITGGRFDLIAPPAQTEELARIFRAVNANVELFWQADGHTLMREEVEHARAWFLKTS